jgi:hypothetical protein
MLKKILCSCERSCCCHLQFRCHGMVKRCRTIFLLRFFFWRSSANLDSEEGRGSRWRVKCHSLGPYNYFYFFSLYLGLIIMMLCVLLIRHSLSFVLSCMIRPGKTHAFFIVSYILFSLAIILVLIKLF